MKKKHEQQIELGSPEKTQPKCVEWIDVKLNTAHRNGSFNRVSNVHCFEFIETIFHHFAANDIVLFIFFLFE